MYAPAHDTDRGRFVAAVAKEGWFKKESIVQGDFNCVASPTLDVKYVDEGSEDAGDRARRNHGVHGQRIEAEMANIGLTDTFRSYAGDTREYTRRATTVLTRLDRWYATAHNSNIEWYDVKTDVHFGRNRKVPSDHYAITATIKPHAPRVTRKPIHTIDPALFENQSVRKLITTLWQDVYKKYNTKKFGHVQVWMIY